MIKLQVTRDKVQGLVGYYCIAGCPSFDVLRINLITKKALVGYYGTQDVYQTDVDVFMVVVDKTTRVAIKVYEGAFTYDLAHFTLDVNWAGNIY